MASASDRPASRRRDGGRAQWHSPAMTRRIRRRYLGDRLFRAAGLAALLAAGLFLLLLVGNIAWQARTGFFQTEVRLEVAIPADVAAGETPGSPGFGAAVDAYPWRSVALSALRDRFGADSRGDLASLRGLISRGGAAVALRAAVRDDPTLIGRRATLWLPASEPADQWAKDRDAATALSERQVGWLESFAAAGDLETRFNGRFFATGNSRDPALAGIGGAVIGSFLTLLVTLAVAFPIGVFTAIYLEEFAPQNRITDFIEVNINNLAAVPSIVFGLLGLQVFLNTFGMPRSAPVVGGLTLALMTLPTIIISGRAALKAVPNSIRDAALGLGASRTQVVLHHVLPAAMPGMLTGTIIGMAQALGETAPLLMIGMVAFIVEVPASFTEAATVLPVQIYMWAELPEAAYRAKTAAGISVLLIFLISMNALAVYLRNRFETK
ncbi:phosphate ABC transporter, permease protein PstA [Rhodothalassium salexigens]|uniref:phosphate ABC transporter permease PstA n=1 Tax=Rhodothalassium salexigens TaxID=1086 RepID=UPI001911EAA6|nr:phosphate ABC transporter permease PstA [Rhodothalassium salexigens]MBK5920563.1 phosphate ABC transporter, permease protein PstA [Rhodothalassium salexigens]